MTYDLERKEAIRTSLTIVEMDLDYCDEEYGVAPCTAAKGVTGPDKCFNVISKDAVANCQDRANYNQITKTYKFCTATTRPPENCIPSILSVDITPTTITPGAGIGKRGAVTITMQDHRYHDRGIDKYFSDRDYDPMQRGTYFGKFFARNTYYQNRELRVREGFLTDPYDAANFQTRTYQIERMTAPDASGIFKVVAKDILKVAANKKALMPLVSVGELQTLITDVAAAPTIELDDASEYNDPTVTLVDEYVIIGDEIFQYTGISGNDLTGTSRAQFNTPQEEHDAGVVVQQCKNYDNVPFADALEDALENFGNVNPAYIPKADWDAELETWLPDLDLNGIIVEPTGTLDIVDEWLSLFLLYIWPDEIDKEIKLSAIKPPFAATFPSLTKEASVVQTTVVVEERVEDRISNVVYHYDIINPTDDLEKKKNYSRLDNPLDSNAESAAEYDERRTRVKFCRWLNAGQKGLIQQMTSREISRFRNNPKFIMFNMDVKDADVWTGDVVKFQSNQIQDGSGDYPEIFIRLLQMKTMKNGEIKVKAEDVRFEGKYFLVSPSPDFDPVEYSLSDPADRLRYGWVGDDTLTNNGFANGDGPYNII